MTDSKGNPRLCPRCRKSGFTVHKGFNRPRFICGGCDYEWSNGHSGEPYFGHAINLKIDETFKDFRTYEP